MARIPSATGLQDQISAVAGKSLRSAEMPFFVLNPPGVTPLQLITSFTANRAYFLPAMRVSFVGAGGWSAKLIVGKSSNPAAYTGLAASDVTLYRLDVSLNTAIFSATQEFVNWNPYGWDLPVGESVHVLLETSMFPWNPTTVGAWGSIVLYLSETFEQS